MVEPFPLSDCLTHPESVRKGNSLMVMVMVIVGLRETDNCSHLMCYLYYSLFSECTHMYMLVYVQVHVCACGRQRTMSGVIFGDAAHLLQGRVSR